VTKTRPALHSTPPRPGRTRRPPPTRPPRQPRHRCPGRRLPPPSPGRRCNGPPGLGGMRRPSGWPPRSGRARRGGPWQWPWQWWLRQRLRCWRARHRRPGQILHGLQLVGVVGAGRRPWPRGRRGRLPCPHHHPRPPPRRRRPPCPPRARLPRARPAPRAAGADRTRGRRRERAWPRCRRRAQAGRPGRPRLFRRGRVCCCCRLCGAAWSAASQGRRPRLLRGAPAAGMAGRQP